MRVVLLWPSDFGNDCWTPAAMAGVLVYTKLVGESEEAAIPLRPRILRQATQLAKSGISKIRNFSRLGGSPSLCVMGEPLFQNQNRFILPAHGT